MMTSPIWDEEQIERLKQMASSGASILRISAALRRNVTSVQVKARKLGIPFVGMREAKRIRDAKIAEAEKKLAQRNGLQNSSFSS
jgi:GcrA cell cycle regulator